MQNLVNLKYKNLNAITNYGVTINSMDGHFLFVNDYFCDIVGYSSDYLLQTNFMSVTHPEDVEKNVALDKLLRDGTIPFFQMKKRYIREDGETTHVLLQVGIIRDEPNVYVAMVIEIDDVVHDMESELSANSDFANALQCLPEDLRYLMSSYQFINKYKEKNIRKSQHLANMAHEMRTPLNAINGFSRRLKNLCKDVLDKRIHTSVDYISHGCTLLNNLIKEIVDYEKLESGALSLNKEIINLHSVLDDTVNLLLPYAEEHDLDLYYHPETNTPFCLEADPSRLNFVFHNLISNAIKYTEEGSITVSTFFLQEGNTAKAIIEISDTGIGIAKEDFDALFDEYKKVHHRISKKVDSIGLGLPIAKKITHMHGGNIEVESELGKGSTFRVIFPAISANAKELVN